MFDNNSKYKASCFSSKRKTQIKIESNKETPPTEHVVIQVNSSLRYIFLQTINFTF